MYPHVHRNTEENYNGILQIENKLDSGYKGITSNKPSMFRNFCTISTFMFHFLSEFILLIKCDLIHSEARPRVI